MVTELRHDADLVERARRGDDHAFGALVQAHQRRALALARSLVGEDADAEDLTQEAFLRALRNLDLLADPEKFSPWLQRIVFGTCIDWLRAFRPGLFQSSAATDEDFLKAQTATPTPLAAAERADLSERVTAALAALPEKYRVPFHLYHLDGLSHERVAEALNAPVATVRSLVHRARHKLAELLPELRDESPRSEDVFDPQPESYSMLHILNGDSVRMTLEQSSVPGRFSVWGDTLYVGPVTRDVSSDEFAELRSRFHAGVHVSYDEAMAMGRRWLEGLESYPNYDEVVLWFEHDLHDQILLVNLLDWFAQRSPRPRALSLICIGEFPSVVPFYGLGQLDADQLASLLGTRQRVTERQLALGQSLWRAFTGDDPTAIERVLARDTSALPFLEGAMRRLLEEFPDERTGLPRTERSLLEILSAKGPLKFGKLFPAHQTAEERPFMGDWTIWDCLEDLARGARPLVHIDRGERELDASISITDDGRRVLAGELDWTQTAPFDRWIGGTHLVSPNVEWRWDSLAGRIVHAS